MGLLIYLQLLFIETAWREHLPDNKNMARSPQAVFRKNKIQSQGFPKISNF